MCLNRIHCSQPNTTQGVLLIRARLKMTGMDTVTDPTQVVKREPIWDFSDCMSVYPSVSQLPPVLVLTGTELRVAIFSCSTQP